MVNVDLDINRRPKIHSLTTRLMLAFLLSCKNSPSSNRLETTADILPNQLRFAGRNWLIKSGQMGPGNNDWNPDNVFVDQVGLHLRITQNGTRWTCSEVALSSALGYGCYTFEVAGQSQVGTNEIVGLFLYQDDENEYDVELGRFGSIHHPGAQYVVQPINSATVVSNRHRFALRPSPTEIIRHSIMLSPMAVSFSSYRHAGSGSPLQHWTYTAHQPLSAATTVHLNYWLFEHMPPADSRPHEIVIRNFTFAQSCRDE